MLWFLSIHYPLARLLQMVSKKCQNVSCHLKKKNKLKQAPQCCGNRCFLCHLYVKCIAIKDLPWPSWLVCFVGISPRALIKPQHLLNRKVKSNGNPRNTNSTRSLHNVNIRRGYQSYMAYTSVHVSGWQCLWQESSQLTRQQIPPSTHPLASSWMIEISFLHQAEQMLILFGGPNRTYLIPLSWAIPAFETCYSLLHLAWQAGTVLDLLESSLW
jgi:hypothetical protein